VACLREYFGFQSKELAYVADLALFPTLSSANPAPSTGLTLARKVAAVIA
jgi:hypothetical protein